MFNGGRKFDFRKKKMADPLPGDRPFSIESWRPINPAIRQ